jgi:outer membrane receptor protein involved in Fe transport
MRVCRFLPCLFLLWAAVNVFGQEPAEPPGVAKEPTLPEIVVRPERQPPAVSDEGSPGPANPYDKPLSYPSLSEQTFGGLNSVTRGDKSLFDVPNLDTVIDQRQLTEKMPLDMFQAIEQEVGVIVQRTANGQASPFVRGLTGQQVLILIDGIRLNNSTFRSGANQYFNTIDPGQVERIEVVRGPQSVYWGADAIGGVINVVTKSASRKRGNYAAPGFTEYFSTADMGSYTRVNAEGWAGENGIFAGASYLNVNDLQTAGPLGKQPFTDYDQYAGDVKFNRLLSEDALLTIALQHFEQRNVPRSDRFPPFSDGPPFNASKPAFFDPQQRDMAYLRLEGKNPSGRIDAYSFTASYERQKEGSIEYSSFPAYLGTASGTRDIGLFDVNTAGLSGLASSDLDPLGRLTYGFDWYHDNVNANKDRYSLPSDTFLQPRTPQFPNDSFYEQFGAFLSWDVPVTDRFDVEAGVRYTDVHLASTPIVQVTPPGGKPIGVPVHIAPGYSGWVGNVGTTYKLTDYLNLCSSVSQGFRAPNLDDLVATNTLVQQTAEDIPTAELQPEKSINYEVGLKLDTPRLRSQAFVYWTDLGDNIVRTPVAVGTFQRANRNSYVNGVEWYGEYMLQSNWSLYGNFAYAYGQNLVDQIPLSRIPPTQGILGLRWRDEQHRRWFDIYGWLVAKQDRLNFQDLTDSRIPPDGTPGFQTLNLRAGRTFGEHKNHQVSLALENILNQAYRVHGSGVDGAGFNAIFGYTYTQ